VANLNLLHYHSSNCPAFKEACMLGKVWLTQRGLTSMGFNGFLWSMMLGYLLRDSVNAAAGKKEGGFVKLGNTYSSYQMVKLTLEFIGKPTSASQFLFYRDSNFLL
jgi:U3 small nucleolar RNA-associated protein 22